MTNKKRDPRVAELLRRKAALAAKPVQQPPQRPPVPKVLPRRGHR